MPHCYNVYCILFIRRAPLESRGPFMWRLTLLAICFLLALAESCDAGMPSVGYTITKVARMRIETLSFFLGAFFLSALGVKWLWNCLARDFVLLPQVTYGKALALITLWGLLFVLVLTMISGA